MQGGNPFFSSLLFSSFSFETNIYLNRFKEVCIFISLQARVNGTTLISDCPAAPYLVRPGMPSEERQLSPGERSRSREIGQWCAGWHPAKLIHMAGTCVWSRWGQCQANSGCAIFLTTAGTNSSRNHSVWRWQCRWWSPEIGKLRSSDKKSQYPSMRCWSTIAACILAAIIMV